MMSVKTATNTSTGCVDDTSSNTSSNAQNETTTSGKMTNMVESNYNDNHHQHEEEEKETNIEIEAQSQQKRPRYKQYLIDRSNGESNYIRRRQSDDNQDDNDINDDDDEIELGKPPCFACYVPKPVVWLSCIVEQNPVFECLGSVGIFKPDNNLARKVMIGFGLFCNIVGLLTSAYSLCSITYEYDTLQWSFFNKLLIAHNGNSIRAKVGMRAIAMSAQIVDDKYSYLEWFLALRSQIQEFTRGSGQALIPSEDYCLIDSLFVRHEYCEACSDVGDRLVFTLSVSLIMCIPSITTSVLRLHENYDCNCQKVFASFAAAISVAFAIWTCLLYKQNCLDIFENKYFCFRPSDGSAFPLPEAGCCCSDYSDDTYNAEVLVQYGPGWYCLVTACIAKIVDMALNFTIPTPTICRDHEEQYRYEQLHLQKQQKHKAEEGEEE